jgi:hypothetical protein
MIRATNSCARRIPKQGVSKNAHRIDSVVALSKTRPLETTNGPTGPFEKALLTFATGGPIPICVGVFGETNTSFDKLVIKLANLAAKTPYGQRLLPYPLQSGCGADTLLHIQFRHLLGVQFVKANARHKKLERLHLVGSTGDEAVHLANGQKQQNSHHWNPYTDCPSRYSNNYGRGSNYQSWYEFRQSSHYFSV